MEERFEKFIPKENSTLWKFGLIKKPVCNMFTICLVMRVECHHFWMQMGNRYLLIYLSLMALSKVEIDF